MQNQNQNINAEQAYRTLVTIWAALLIGIILFLVLIYFVKPEVYKFDFSKPLLGENPTLVIVLFVAAIVDFVMSIVLRRKKLNQAIADQSIGQVQTAMITGLALCQSIALFGLLLVFLQNYQYFFLFFALAILGFIIHFPRRDDVFAASYKR